MPLPDSKSRRPASTPPRPASRSRRPACTPRPPAAALALIAAAVALPPLVFGGLGGISPSPEPAYAANGGPCPGEPLPDPDRVIEDSFGPDLQGSYVMVPFKVPPKTTALRIKYCFDQPSISTQNSHTLDMGIYGPRGKGKLGWGPRELRGWGGSSRRDVTISPRAVDPENPDPARKDTTVGYRPGPVRAGRWAVELGVAALGSELLGEDGRVNWRVEIDLIKDRSYAKPRYRPTPYDSTPASRKPGWYSGDLHVHARHSNPNDATMRETFDYAFSPPGAGAGLDFITLSDYNTDRHWDEIGRHQDRYRGKLIVRSAEVITYRGHINNHASGRFVDYRTGPVLLRRPDGRIEQLRGPRPASKILGKIRAAGGVTQLNHVETFPSEVPTFSNLCRGCSWEYSDRETDYSLVDAIEVSTGPAGLQGDVVQPGPNPFSLLAVLFYERALGLGHRIAAVGSSDSHNAGTPDDPITQSPIGQATTVMRAPELSERGFRRAIRARRTYVKLWGPDAPDVSWRAETPSAKRTIGGVIRGGPAHFKAMISGLEGARDARPGIYVAYVLRNGSPIRIEPLPPGDVHRFSLSAAEPGRYGLAIARETALEVYTTPIWLEQ